MPTFTGLRRHYNSAPAEIRQAYFDLPPADQFQIDLAATTLAAKVPEMGMGSALELLYKLGRFMKAKGV
jgi:hypothetical protein